MLHFNTAIMYAMDERIDSIDINDVKILHLRDRYMTRNYAYYRCNILPVHLTKGVSKNENKIDPALNPDSYRRCFILRSKLILMVNG